jgi:AcrR family transcriptional regulator
MVKPFAQKDTGADDSAEKKILAAARVEFIVHGLRGARMQEIADRARANKALLHYYFRSKEKLYEAVIADIVRTVGSGVREQLAQEKKDGDLRFLLRQIVTGYITVFRKNPDIPRFIMREIVDGGTHLEAIFMMIATSFGDIPVRIYGHLISEGRAGRLRKIPPIHIALNLIGMSIFVFMARPIIDVMDTKLKLNLKFDDEFYQQRIDAIVVMACDGMFSRGKRS